MERFEAVGEQERSAFITSFGPLTVGFDDLVGLRLNEHGMHTWDVEVTLNPAAGLHPEQTALIIDNLGLLALHRQADGIAAHDHGPHHRAGTRLRRRPGNRLGHVQPGAR